MISKHTIFTFLFLSFSFFWGFAQDNEVQEEPKEDDNKTEEQRSKSYIPVEELVVQNADVDKKTLDPLAPSRAAFYSAILPGLGQAYNRRYWKIPIVYAGLGIGLYFYIDNDKQYDRYRDAYKRRLAGFTDDEFYGVVTDDGLREAQETLRKNKEISLLVTIGLYALNIIDANVDAHLLQYNVDDDLSIRPHYKINEMNNKGDLGLTLNFKF